MTQRNLPPIDIVDTQVANIASLQAAFRRLDRSTRLVADADAVRRSRFLVLPGVGSFGAAVKQLRDRGLSDAIRERFESALPALAICLGMQLLCESSEESPGVAGLGLLPVAVRRFGNDVQVPQLGWNEVVFPGGPSGHAYFANSFRMVDPPQNWQAATTDYGGPFVSALRRDCCLICQFHPELSGKFGQQLLKSWLSNPC